MTTFPPPLVNVVCERPLRVNVSYFRACKIVSKQLSKIAPVQVWLLQNPFKTAKFVECFFLLKHLHSWFTSILDFYGITNRHLVTFYVAFFSYYQKIGAPNKERAMLNRILSTVKKLFNFHATFLYFRDGGRSKIRRASCSTLIERLI